MTVAPSLVMVCFPFSSTRSKSPPYGPSVPLMVDCTARQALMLERICPRPCDWSVPAAQSVQAFLLDEARRQELRAHTLAQDHDGGRLPAERHGRGL